MYYPILIILFLSKITTLITHEPFFIHKSKSKSKSKPIFHIMPLFMSRAFFFLHTRPRSLSSMADLTSVSTTNVSPKARLKGVVFDMDGTLTIPVIDFPAMYKAVLGEDEYLAVKSKSPSGIDILHHIENWSPDKQKKAYEIIADFENQGLDRLQIMPGASELCGFLDSRNIRNLFTFKWPRVNSPITVYVEIRCEKFHWNSAHVIVLLDGGSWKLRRGLITRNVKAAVDLFHKRFGLVFSPALSREFRPYKPNPAPLLHICSTWEVQPNEIMMIGDSLKDDVACGKRAGAFTCLLDETGRYNSPEYATVEFQPDYKVSSLAEVFAILESNFDLAP